MSCCGQKRQALATINTNTAPRPLARAAAAPPSKPYVDPAAAARRGETLAGRGAASGAAATQSLRYLAQSPIVVRGPATGAHYRFSAAQPVQRVARADCEPLLRTGHFVLQA